VYQYFVYGLKVSSEIELPELYPFEFQLADVHIRLGAVPQGLRSPVIHTDWIDLAHKACLLRVPRVGRLLVRNGETITIDVGFFPKDSDLAMELRLIVLGSALGALLHQRGSLPLHIATVMTAHGIVGFTGLSGAGKSTLAGWFLKQRQRPLFSDDVAALDFPEDSLRLSPGPRRLKLGLDTVERLGLDAGRASRLSSNGSKYQIVVNQTVAPSPGPLIAIVDLARHASPAAPLFEPIRGKDAFDVIMSAVYRPIIGDWFHGHDRMVRMIVGLCDRTEVYRFTRSWSLDRLAADLEFLADRVEAIRTGSPLTVEKLVVADA